MDPLLKLLWRATTRLPYFRYGYVVLEHYIMTRYFLRIGKVPVLYIEPSVTEIKLKETGRPISFLM